MTRRLAFLMAVLFALAAAALAPTPAPAQSSDQVLRVGSKRFTESYLLGEILARTAQTRMRAVHVPGLGNTAIVFEALRQGSIDLYPEYLGTIALEILKLGQAEQSLEAVNRHLAPLGLAASIPLGFSNNYALAVRADTAGELKAAAIGELVAHPGLRFGLSHEFLGRADGWPGLKARYGLPQAPRGLDHGLAYEALAAGTIDVTDVYSTDAKISRYGLRVLDDELGFFPRYDAVVLHRRDLPERFPQAWSALSALTGSIDADRMIALNAAAELQGKSFAEVAQAFLADLQRSREVQSASGTSAPGTGTPASTRTAIDAEGPAGPGGRRGLWQALAADDFWRLAIQHLLLVLVSVGAAVLVAVPAGIAAVILPRFGAVLLAVVGAVQTVPSLALLALLVTAIGSIGTFPALVALFAYALLPIVRNVVVGLQAIAPGIRDASAALGLRPGQRLALIELPLALPVIVAGIRVAAVISVGTATIAAFVGAGGFGERIVTGLALNDRQMLLAGALPAAGLAFLMEGLFALVERRSSRWSSKAG